MSTLELVFESGESSLSVRRFAIHEAVSSLFTISVWARSPSPDLDLQTIVGRPASLRLASGYKFARLGGARLWTGICNHIELVHGVEPEPGETPLSTYSLRIVPALWLLTQRRYHRIFQHLSIPDIADELLAEWHIEPVWDVDRARYPKLEYKVQYGETDYAFLSRLLEEAGIAFTLSSEVDGEGESGSKLILSDKLHQNQARPGPPLHYVDGPNQAAEMEFVTNVRLAHEVRPGAHVFRDYDFRNPAFPLFSDAPKASAPEDKYERLHYRPGAFLIETGEGGGGAAADDKGMARHDPRYGAARAERALVAGRVGRRAVAFETNTIDLWPGAVFAVGAHPHPAIGEGDLLLITEFSLDGTPEGQWTMSGRAVFAAEPYRPPPKTPKPEVRGVQSAIVVGPVGEEIHTDEFGRVRVQFPWDREGDNDDNSSCWIRVSQGWAGTGFGMITLPRVGQEVLIGFLVGDPDQPIVVGRVFNAIQPVPYKLPENKTQSGWKSEGSPSGGGLNEIKLEDKAGDELLYFQAERNLRHLVKRDETITVVRDRTKLVEVDEVDTTGVNRIEVTGVNRSAMVRATWTTVISGNRRKRIKKSETEQIARRALVLVNKDQHLVTKKRKRERVEEDVHLLVKGKRSEKIEKSQSLTIVKHKRERVDGSYALDAGQQIHIIAGTTLIGEGGQDVTIKTPGGFVRIDSGGITIYGMPVKINAGGRAGKGKGSAPEAPEEPPEPELSVDEDEETEGEEEVDEIRGQGQGRAGMGPGPGQRGKLAKKKTPKRPIDDPKVKAAMNQAWKDSLAGDPAKRHEEGGYIVKNKDGTYDVERWPTGGGASITPPPRAADGTYKGREVVGEFHTHPNPPVDEKGKKWTQGGHAGDWNGIAAEKYPGESYIISRDNVWVVDSKGKPTLDKSGNEVPCGSRETLLGK